MPVATVILLLAICGFVQSSEFHPFATEGVAPVVTAASSQYFERTFNRLVAVPALQPVFPVAPPPPVVVDAKTLITPVIPTHLPQPVPIDSNVAIAIATAYAAAPVATILLPPYPFGLPPGFIPSAPPFNVPSVNPNREPTTQKTTTTIQATNTEKDLEVSPFPSNNANSFAQAASSNENVNFRQYLTPPLPLEPLPHPVRPYQLPSRPAPTPPRPVPRPAQPQPPPPQRPIKLKTTVEVVPVPLAYIAPPPMFTQSHIHAHSHDHHNHIHAHVKDPHLHYHTFIPKKTKIIIRPVRTHTLRVPARLVAYKPMPRSSGPRYPQNAFRVSNPREREPTTFRPINRPMTKPPRLL